MSELIVETLEHDTLHWEDALGLAALSMKVWPEHMPAGPEQTARKMLDAAPYQGPPAQRPRTFCIRDGGRIVARSHFFGREVHTPAGPMTVLALAGVCSDPDYRGQGLGKRVVQAAFAVVDEGAFPLSLYQTSPPVQAFYEHLGARRVHNHMVNALADDPAANPFWDEIIMIYPAGAAWPEGTIDINGPAW